MSHRLAVFLGSILVLAPLGESVGQKPEASKKVRRILRELTLEEKAAQLVMLSLPGSYTAYDAEAMQRFVAWVDSLAIGGVIVSSGSPLDIASRVNYLQEHSRLPLLFASDLEGGSAFRFTGGTPFPTNMGVAATGREQDAYEMGRITAAEGKAAGIQLVFAPVADVNNNPANPVINTRSFGGDPGAVGRLVAATVRGIQSTGTVATVKHYPGHGNTGTDSHISLPVIGARWDELITAELVPFRAAIDAGVGAVMSAHIALPRIEPDSTLPATLSRLFMSDALRDSLGFRGLVVTDALDMGALVTRFGPGELAVRSLEAGADLLLMPTNPVETVRAVAEAVRAQRISVDRLDQSVLKILTLKEKAGLFRRRTVSLDMVAQVVGQREYTDTARAVTARSLVLVRDSAGVVERVRRAPTQLALIAFDDRADATASTLASALRGRGHTIVSSARLVPASGVASYDSARAAIRPGVTTVFAVTVRAVASRGTVTMPDALVSLIAEAEATGDVILVSLGSPYLLSQTPTVGSVLLAWTNNVLVDQAIAAALAGAPITGRAPIDHPPFYRTGDGILLPVEPNTTSKRDPNPH